MRTFIVEDSPVILENLVSALEELTPARVVGTAADENNAVSWLVDKGNTCDLVILDIFLKDGSGLGVLKALSQARVPGKWVVLTNYATPDMREKCSALGAHQVFDKSNELDEMLNYCKRVASGNSDTQPAYFS